MPLQPTKYHRESYTRRLNRVTSLAMVTHDSLVTAALTQYAGNPNFKQFVDKLMVQLLGWLNPHEVETFFRAELALPTGKQTTVVEQVLKLYAHEESC